MKGAAAALGERDIEGEFTEHFIKVTPPCRCDGPDVMVPLKRGSQGGACDEKEWRVNF